MKFSIEKNILLQSLQLLSKAIPTRSTLPILSCALFKIENKNLHIRSTDLEISIKSKCEISNSENGSIAIPLSKLLEITNVMPNELINFNISDIGKVNIECSSGMYTIMGLTSDEFPAEQKIESSNTLKLLGKEFNNIINNTSYATSSDDLKPVLQGVLFHIQKNEIISVATDGHRLVKLEKKNLENLNFEGTIIIPTKFLNLINSQIKETEQLNMVVGSNHIQINIVNTTITTRTIQDSYPDYESVIPKDNQKTLIIDKERFSSAIKRVSIFSNKSSRQIALELSENHMKITTEDPENITTGKEIIDCEYDGEPMTIGYNAKYLNEVVQHQNTSEIKILLNTPLNAGLFIPIEQKENTNQTTLLMPIRLND